MEVRENFRHLFYGVGIYPDGVGTKTVPHTSMKRHFVAAHDIGAMTLDDAATQGDRATSFNSVLEARDV